MRVNFSSVRVAFKTYFANTFAKCSLSSPVYASVRLLYETQGLWLIFIRSIMNMATVVYVQ